MTIPLKVAVTGAAGQICYSLLFRIAAGGMFGPEQPIALSLLESPQAMPILDTVMMELADGAFPLLAGVRADSDPARAFEGADWVILIGSAPYKIGSPRSELLLANAPIFQQQGRAINEASPKARTLVVANPCNTNCLVAMSMARDVPAEHWFAMTRLDENRARSLIAEKAKVSVARVNRLAVWGDHGPTIYPDLHNTFVDDRPAPELIADPHWESSTFEPTVRGRGRRIYESRKASPAGSAAQAIIGTVRSITTPTPLEQRFNAAVVSDGSYGVPRGLIFGFPLRTEDGKSWSIVQGLYHDDRGLQRLAENVAQLEKEAAIVTHFLGSTR